MEKELCFSVSDALALKTAHRCVYSMAEAGVFPWLGKNVTLMRVTQLGNGMQFVFWVEMARNQRCFRETSIDERSLPVWVTLHYPQEYEQLTVLDVAVVWRYCEDPRVGEKILSKGISSQDFAALTTRGRRSRVETASRLFREFIPEK